MEQSCKLFCIEPAASALCQCSAQDLTIISFWRARCLHAATSNPIQNRSVFIAGLISMPTLATVVRGQIVAHIARAVGGAGGFDEHEALVRFGNVHNAHRVLVVVFTVLIRKPALGIGRLQLEDHMTGVAVYAGLPVRSGL